MTNQEVIDSFLSLSDCDTKVEIAEMFLDDRITKEEFIEMAKKLVETLNRPFIVKLQHNI